MLFLIFSGNKIPFVAKALYVKQTSSIFFEYFASYVRYLHLLAGNEV